MRKTFILTFVLLFSILSIGICEAAFYDNGDGTITDTTLGLMWQKADDGLKYSWSNAVIYTNNLQLASYNDWRLPTMTELTSISDANYQPAINQIFTVNQNFADNWHWAYWTNIENRVRYFWGDGWQGGDNTSAGIRAVRDCTIATIAGSPSSPTNSTAATLTVGGNDVVAYMYKLDDGSYSAETDISNSINLTGLTEGAHTVSVIGKDAAGNWQAEADATTATWTVDTTGPTATVQIDGGAAHTSSKSVLLGLTSSDAEQMCFSNDNQTYTEWETFGSSKTWTLTDGDGQKRVYAKFNDGLGNASTVSDTIVLDTAAPSGTVDINDNAEYVTEDTVTLNLDAADAVYVCFSNDGETYTDWESYTNTKNWTLSDGDGQKTVYVKYKDAAGNVSTVSYEILLDSTPPGTPILVDIGATDNNEPLLDWEVTDTTKFYELEHGSNADMTSSEKVVGIGPSEYGMPTALADGTWYWRVRAIDDYGNVGSWSNIGAFTIDTAQNCETIISQPLLLSPADNAVNVSLDPTLATSGFNDGGNCSAHWKTHWKINDRADDFNGATVFNYISMDHSKRNTGNSTQMRGNLTSLEIPSMILEPGATYYWKVRYHGDRGNKSEWSEVYSFTTENDPDDQNDDGLPDDAEVDDDTDLNDDSIPDKDQVGVMTSIKVKNGKKKIGIESNACVVSRVCVMDEQDIDDDDNKPDQMPYGLIGYKFETPHFGETVSVKIHLSEPAPVSAKWVFYDKISGWQDYSGYTSFNQARDEITLELKDGGFGDEDHTENRCIIDPGGIGIYDSESVTSSSGGSGGCFINTIFKK